MSGPTLQPWPFGDHPQAHRRAAAGDPLDGSQGRVKGVLWLEVRTTVPK